MTIDQTLLLLEIKLEIIAVYQIHILLLLKFWEI